MLLQQISRLLYQDRHGKQCERNHPSLQIWKLCSERIWMAMNLELIWRGNVKEPVEPLMTNWRWPQTVQAPGPFLRFWNRLIGPSKAQVTWRFRCKSHKKKLPPFAQEKNWKTTSWVLTKPSRRHDHSAKNFVHEHREFTSGRRRRGLARWRAPRRFAGLTRPANRWAWTTSAGTYAGLLAAVGTICIAIAGFVCLLSPSMADATTSNR